MNYFHSSFLPAALHLDSMNRPDGPLLSPDILTVGDLPWLFLLPHLLLLSVCFLLMFCRSLPTQSQPVPFTYKCDNLFLFHTSSSFFYPFTDPSVIPSTKYLCRNGYTISTGIIAINIFAASNERLFNFIACAICSTFIVE